ncbi:hypothetical protein GGGNBK_04440 [Sporosarcina sp. ANT_H38]
MKHSKETVPSYIVIMGRPALTPEIFLYLENQKTGVVGDFQLTYVIQKFKSNSVFVCLVGIQISVILYLEG